MQVLIGTLILALINTIIGYVLQGIVAMFGYLAVDIQIDFSIVDNINSYLLPIIFSFMMVKTVFTVLNNYLLNFTDERLAYRNPSGIVLGMIKAIMAIVFIPYYVEGIWRLSQLLVRLIGEMPTIDVNILDLQTHDMINTIPLIVMVIVYLLAFVVILIQFCLRAAEFVFAIPSGYVFAVGLINDQANSPAFNNWFTKVLGLGFVNASQILCIHLSAGALNQFIQGNKGAVSLAIGFIVLCATTPATIKQVAHSTGLRSGINKGFNAVRMLKR